MTVMDLVATLSLDASKYTESLNKAKKQADGFGGKIQGAGAKVTKAGIALSKVGAITGVVLGASVKNASDFQQGMNKVNTIANLNAKDLKKLSGELLNLSTDTGKSATEIAEASYQALSASVPTDKLVEFTKVSANLAKTGFTETATAVDVLSTAMNAYGKKAGTAESIANKLLQTQNDGKTTVNELAHSMGQVIPVASANNVSIDNLTSAYALMTKQGINTANSTTYIKRMISELSKEGSTVATTLKQKTGKSFSELMAEGKSLGDVIGILSDSVNGDKVAFQNLWKSQVSGMGALALLNQGTEEFNKEMQRMGDSSSNMSNALEKLKSPAGDLKKSLNALKNASISLGAEGLALIAPVADKVAKAFQGFAKWVEGANPALKKVVISLLAVVTASGPVLIIVGKLVGSIGQGISTISKFGTAIKTAMAGAKGLGGVIGAIASPVGIAVLAIGALIAVFATLWKTNDTFRVQVTAIWGNIVAMFKEFVSEIKARMGGISEAFTNIINVIKPLWMAFCNSLAPTIITTFGVIKSVIATTLSVILGLIDVFTGVFTGDWKKVSSGVKTIVNGLKKGVVSIFKAMVSLIKTTVKGMVDGVIKFFKTMPSKINTVLKNLVKLAKSAVKSLKTALANGAKNAVSAMVNGMKSLPGKISSVMRGVASKALSWGKDIPRAIANGIAKTAGAVTGAVKKVASKIRSMLHFTTPDEGPLADFDTYMPDMIDLMVRGIRAGAPKVGKAVSDLAESLVEPVDLGDAFDVEDMPAYDTYDVGRNPTEVEDVTYIDDKKRDDKAVEKYLQAILTALGEFEVVLDDGTLVGKLAPRIDAQLGDVYRIKNRRNAW